MAINGSDPPETAGSPLVGGDVASWSAEATVQSLLSLVPLDHLPRTGWVLRGIEAPESIAGHILGVAYVALALAPQAARDLDLGRVLSMALVHDAAEAVTGDLPRPASKELPEGAKRTMEASVAEPLLGPFPGPALAAFEEFLGQDSPEARFVKQCDRIQLGVRLLAYERSGRSGLDEFWGGLEPSEAGAEFPVVDEILAVLRAGRISG